MRHLRGQERQRRFFAHYHAGASPTGRTSSQTEMQTLSPTPYQKATLHDLDLSKLELRVIINWQLARPQRIDGMSPSFATNYTLQDQHMHTAASKRIASILRYGSKARKVDAKRALGLNMPAAPTLQLLRFMKCRNSHITVEY